MVALKQLLPLLIYCAEYTLNHEGFGMNNPKLHSIKFTHRCITYAHVNILYLNTAVTYMMIYYFTAQSYNFNREGNTCIIRIMWCSRNETSQCNKTYKEVCITTPPPHITTLSMQIVYLLTWGSYAENVNTDAINAAFSSTIQQWKQMLYNHTDLPNLLHTNTVTNCHTPQNIGRPFWLVINDVNVPILYSDV
jgi:hypothetical protein